MTDGRHGLQSVPTFALLRVDGVRHELGDAAVIREREAFPGTLPWSLEVAGPAAEPFLAAAAAGAPVRAMAPEWRPSPALTARLLVELRVLLLGTGEGRSRFSISTIDRVQTGPWHVRLVGTCAPLLPVAPALRQRYDGAMKPISKLLLASLAAELWRQLTT